MLEGLHRAEHYPAYADLVTTDVGELWVGSYPGQLAAQHQARDPERSWLVVDSAGVLVARVGTPAGFRPHAVRQGRVWGVFQDSLDVETVRAYGVPAG
jgi:hypothetical protein